MLRGTRIDWTRDIDAALPQLGGRQRPLLSRARQAGLIREADRQKTTSNQ